MRETTSAIPAKPIIVVFAAMMVAAACFAWFVVRNVRRDALVADQAAKAAAWAILAYADHEGEFPTDRTQLETAFGLGRGGGLVAAPPWWTAVSAPPLDRPQAWPARLDDAGLSSSAAVTEGLTRALRTLSIQFAADPRQPPRIGGGGQPTSLGTLTEVNGWLQSWADARWPALDGRTRGGSAKRPVYHPSVCRGSGHRDPSHATP